MVEAVLFDCDGVLVDSELISKNVLVELAADLGVNIDPLVALEQFAGRRMADCLEDVEEALGKALPADFMATLRKHEYIALEAQVTPIPGVDRFIASLTVPVCVASNGPREKIECTLGATGLRALFGENIFSAYDRGVFKPEPDLYLTAAKSLGTSAERCVVMEDSIPGAQAGLAAGARVIAYTPDVDRSRFPRHENLYFVKSMDEATQLVASLSTTRQQ